MIGNSSTQGLDLCMHISDNLDLSRESKIPVEAMLVCQLGYPNLYTRTELLETEFTREQSLQASSK
jgi:hypothetical protein